jgi:hypothetical protein
MAITLTAQGKEPLPTGEYRVELTAIELSDGPYGEQLRWTFRVVEAGRHLVAYSTLSPSLASKCMRWASALLGRPIQPKEQVEFDALIGKTAIAVVVKKRKEDGREFNTIDDLLPLRSTTAAADATAENDLFP